MPMGRLWILALFSLAGGLSVVRTAAQWEEPGMEEEQGRFGEGVQSLMCQILTVFLPMLILLVMTMQGT